MPDVIVSVIIPTYNRARDLARAVKSACGQTLREIEIIVVDDNDPASEARHLTEDVMQTLLPADGRIQYIKHPANKNGSAARNTGLRAAKGKYIAFLDDDDYFLSEKLEKEAALLDSLDDEYAMAVCNYYVSRKGKMSGAKEVDGDEWPMVQVLSCRYNTGSGTNMFVKRSVLEELGGFDESLLRHQDYDMEARILTKYKFKKLAQPLFVVEYYSDHLNVPDLDKAVLRRQEYLAKHRELIESLPEDSQRQIYYKIYKRLCELALNSKRPEDAKRFYKQACEYIQPTAKEKLLLAVRTAWPYVPRSIKTLLQRGR